MLELRHHRRQRGDLTVAELKNNQLQTLKAAILADPALASQPPTADGAFAIAAALNAIAAPAFIVWRTSVEVSEIMSNGFRWTDVDGLTAAKYRTWELMVQLGTLNPSRPNVRQGIRDCWGNGSPQETAILVHFKRQATRAEKLLANGTGTDAEPANLRFEGELSYLDVIAARAA